MPEQVLDLWPADFLQADHNAYPHVDYQEQEWAEGPEWGGGRCVKQVTEPTLTVYRSEQPNGCGLIICPGGGYNMLCLDREGHWLAQRFARDGMTCAVLKYRHFDQERAWLDAQRAIRFMRHHAAAWKLRSDAIGIGGFSAGGHLSVHAACRQDPAHARPVADAIDEQDSRPDFMLPIYAALRLAGRVALHPDCVVDAQTPPCFLVHGANDEIVAVENTLRFFDELQQAGVASEMHIYQDGKHGFDWSDPETAQGMWPAMFVHWLRTNGFII